MTDDTAMEVTGKGPTHTLETHVQRNVSQGHIERSYCSIHVYGVAVTDGSLCSRFYSICPYNNNIHTNPIVNFCSYHTMVSAERQDWLQPRRNWLMPYGNWLSPHHNRL